MLRNSQKSDSREGKKLLLVTIAFKREVSVDSAVAGKKPGCRDLGRSPGT